MLKSLIAVTLLIAPAAASAQTQPVQGSTVQDQAVQDAPPKRIRNVALRATEQCPPSTGDEIIVCSVIDEPYRIPKQFRRLAPSAENRSWVARTEELDDVGRVAGGLPDTCSTVGNGGQTGCTQQLINQWRAARREQQQYADPTP